MPIKKFQLQVVFVDIIIPRFLIFFFYISLNFLLLCALSEQLVSFSYFYLITRLRSNQIAALHKGLLNGLGPKLSDVKKLRFASHNPKNYYIFWGTSYDCFKKVYEILFNNKPVYMSMLLLFHYFGQSWTYHHLKFVLISRESLETQAVYLHRR